MRLDNALAHRYNEADYTFPYNYVHATTTWTTRDNVVRFTQLCGIEAMKEGMAQCPAHMCGRQRS